MNRRSSRTLLFPLLASFLPALLLLGAVELGVRAAFWLRNRLAEVTPIVYVFGDDVGPVPPWHTSMIEGDPLLRWRDALISLKVIALSTQTVAR
jgi:hypothetical protein